MRSEILRGEDAVEIAGLWQKLYEGTFWPGRRGLGMHAISAIDVALHDLAGKQLGLPAYKLMGGARRERLRPYCTIYPGLAHGRPVAELMREIGRQFEAALAAGFRAVKMEVLFYDLVTDAELIGLIREGRRMLGDDILMALDFGYRWRNWHDALHVLDRVADCDIFFAEATLQHDDLDGPRPAGGEGACPDLRGRGGGDPLGGAGVARRAAGWAWFSPMSPAAAG